MRSISTGAEELLGKEIKVLDHGFVQPIDYMGNDTDIIQAARISYGPSSRPLRDDRGLLRYLMANHHTTPFEMCEVKYRMKLPIFVARHLVRTRTANLNEMSLRYTEAPDEFYLPELEQISLQSTENKQGRSPTILSPEVKARVQSLLHAQENAAYAVYQELVEDLGIAKELARTVLPVAVYTQWIWKIDLHNLLRFLRLRLDPHAQWETRQFAEALATFVKAWVPIAWEAFEDYQLHAVSLSRIEHTILLKALNGMPLVEADFELLSAREKKDFFRKFPQLVRG